MSGWLRMLLAGLAAAFVPAAALAAEPLPKPPYTHDSFAFAGPTQPRRVEFAAAQGQAGRQATITVRLRNRTTLSGPVSLRFFPVGGGRVVDLLAGSQEQTLPIRLTEPQVGTLRLGARDYALLRLELTVPTGERLAAADGVLVAQLHARGSHGPVARLRIHAISAPLRFDPPKLSMTAERGFRGVHGATDTVVIRGTGAGALAFGPQVLGATVLHDGDASVHVRLELVPGAQGRGSSVAHVIASDFEGVGHFSGVLPVDDAVGVRPLRLDMDVGYSLLIAALVVFIGSFVGALFVRYTGVRRRARLLRLELQSALSRYDDLAKEQVASYRLDRWLEPREGTSRLTTFPGSRGTAALLWNLRTARTTADIEQDAPKVRQVIGHIERWLTVEPVAREAVRTVRRKPDKREGASFLNRPLYRETVHVLDEVRVAPTEGLHDDDLSPERERALRKRADERAESLVARLADQTSVLNLAFVLWALFAGFDQLSDDELPESRRAEIARLDLFRDNDPEQATYWEHIGTTELRVDLRERIDRLREWWPEAHPLPGFESEASAEELVETAFRLESTAMNPEIVPLQRTSSFRAWLHFRQIQASDWAWSLVRAAIGVIAYALTFHNATWGRPEDFLTALTTGFVAETIVPWAALPAWQSIRNRAAKTEDTADEKPDETAQGTAGHDAPGSPPPPPQPPSSPPAAPRAQRPIPVVVRRGAGAVEIEASVSHDTREAFRTLCGECDPVDQAEPTADELLGPMLEILGRCMSAQPGARPGESAVLLVTSSGWDVPAMTYVLADEQESHLAAGVRSALEGRRPRASAIVRPFAPGEGELPTAVCVVLVDPEGRERTVVCEVFVRPDGTAVLSPVEDGEATLASDEVAAILHDAFGAVAAPPVS